MSHLLDEELARLCQNGDDSAFEVLIKRYEKQIFSLSYRLCGNYDEAADLAQEAFIQLYKALPRYDAGKKFFSWMYRVAHNACINALQKRPQNATDLDSIAEIVADGESIANQPEAAYNNKELGEQIDKAILALPDKFREPIYLRYIKELSYQEIGAYLNLPVSTIETRLFRGKQLLQKNLKDYIGRGR